MHTISIDNKNCLFLNHQQLIKDLYRQHTDSKYTSYYLKSQLFNFKAKLSSSTNEIKSETNLNSKQQNRKRKAETENANTPKENLQLQKFLSEIKQNFLPINTSQDDLPRFWEESQEFPQFRGANATNDFQITKFNQIEYIIPPLTKFFNYNIEDLEKLLPELEIYDLLVMDMPWQNKYIKRLKKVKQSLAYKMLDNDTLAKMPIAQLIHNNSLVVLWCTNALQHRQAIENDFLPKWNLKLAHTLKWFKLNVEGDLISPLRAEGYKQPYELLYIACHKDRDLEDLKDLKKLDFLASIPSIIHSHKPSLVEWLKKFVCCNANNFKGLEIFARYLQPQFTSIGLEVIKLMDQRLYEKQN